MKLIETKKVTINLGNQEGTAKEPKINSDEEEN